MRCVARPVAAAATACALALSGCSSEGAQRRTPQDAKPLTTYHGDGFTIDLPGEPRVTTEDLAGGDGSARLTVYTVTSSDSEVSASVIEVPGATPAALEQLSSVFTTQAGATLTRDEAVTYAGVDGRDYTFTTVYADKGATRARTYFLRLLIDDDRLVGVGESVEGRPDEPPDNYVAILESLVLE